MRALRVIKQVAPKLHLLYHMAEATVVNPHTHDCKEGSFKSIDMVHELDVLSGDSVQLTLAPTPPPPLAKGREGKGRK